VPSDRSAHTPAARRERVIEVAAMVLLAAAAAAVCLSGNLGSEFWWNDAARHAMDGVFLLDAVRDLPASLHVYQYATEYYARYPSLALVHYPPFFPAVEAVFFAMFGVTVATARVTVAAFGAVGAVFGYLVARRFVGRVGAALFVLFLIATPELVYWSREVMLEVPMLAMMLAASYCFLAYVDDGRRGAGVLAAAAFGLAVLTKQNAACIAPVWGAYAVWRRGWGVLWKRETLLGAAVACVLLVPFALLTVRLAPLNVSQSVGNATGEFRSPRLSLASVLFYPAHVRFYATTLCLAGIVLLVLVAAFGRRAAWATAEGARLCQGVAFGALWVVVCYGLFTFVIAIKEWRHILAWTPGVALLGASGFSALRLLGRPGRWAAAAAVAVAAGQAVACGLGLRYDVWTLPAPFVSGTEAVARRLAASPRGTVVLYGGNLDGNFIFNLRRFDRGRNVVVLRVSKLFFTMPAMKAHGMTVRISTRDEMLAMMRGLGVRYVLVEDPCPAFDGVGRVMAELRGLVRSDIFVRRAEHRIEDRKAALAARIELYEFREPRPADEEWLTIHVPLGGQVIRVPLERLGVPTRRRPEAERAGPGKTPTPDP